MKVYNIFLIFFVLVILSCRNHVDVSNSETNPDTELPQHSIFHLTSVWHTQDGNEIQLMDLKGKAIVMVMIYTSCNAACPRLVADMRNLAASVDEKELKNIHFVLVSIDPETDTPERLHQFAVDNKMDAAHWTFLRGTEYTTRELANVLSVKYEEISPIDFSHSNIISVFNPQGVLIHQQEELGLDNQQTIDKINQVLQQG